jgi:hypothetical protein
LDDEDVIRAAVQVGIFVDGDANRGNHKRVDPRRLWDGAEELLEIRKLSYALGAAEELLVGSYKLPYALSLREELMGVASYQSL